MLGFLDKARDLARTQHDIKLHRKQCLYLKERLEQTLNFVLEIVESYDRVPGQYKEVLKELHRVVQKVKTFIDDCCYENENEFVLAAIRVTAHEGRFLQYSVELDWCIFLVQCLRDANLQGTPVHCQTLQKFDLEQKRLILKKETSNMIAADKGDLKALLESCIAKQGEHQAICWTLVRRLEGNLDPNTLPGDLGVPPIFTSSHGKFIGKGGFGIVYEINWEDKPFAVKVFEIDSVESSSNEVQILGNCCHPYIVNLILAHKKDRNQYLMMERLSMDLESYIEIFRKGDKFSALEVVDMISQVCEGMLYLDGKRVSHRDLKPRNILVKENPDILVKKNRVLELQVADFGLAKVRMNLEGRYSNSENTPNRGTTIYRAPEMTQKPGSKDKSMGSSMKADIYSFALTCNFILTGRQPLKGSRPVLPDDCPPALASLLQQCWHPEPTRRPENFKEILTKLRKLKADLLTGAVDNQRETEAQKNYRIVTFNAGDRPLRILALGESSELVETAISQICGAVRRTQVGAQCVNMTEIRSSSPPMIVYSDTRGSGNHFKDIKSFVESRNKRSHHAQVEDLWMDYIHRSGGGDRPTLFINSTSRIHMVWFVCKTTLDLPHNFRWSDITKELCGLPVQILVIGAMGHLDFKYNKIVELGSHLFPNDQNLKDLIVRVDPTDRNWKETLWRACSSVKTRAEIENAAKIITWISKKLGRGGVAIPVGVGGAKIPKGVSLSQSGKFVLSFLCRYWDFPEHSIHGVLQNLTTFEPPPDKIIRIKHREFVKFCLQVAAIILYSASNPEYVFSWVPDESLEMEAQACYNSYFADSEGIDYDQMAFKDIQAFLQSIFERKAVLSLVSVNRRNSIVSKIQMKLCSWRRR